ncbi:MAG: hypothetical protein Q7R78_00075 [bacterium]|nr:hypothetical protein [bacterium]
MEYTEKYRIYSESSKRTHIVGKLESGEYTCDCRGWTGHMPRPCCKHIREVLYTHPEPLDLANYEKLQGKKGKVNKAFDTLKNSWTTQAAGTIKE